MTTEGNRIEWVFWLLWILITAMGWILGFFIGFILASMIGDSVIGISVFGRMLAGFLYGAAFGSLVGLMQWLILRERVSRIGWWTLASAAGLAVVMGAGNALGALGSLDELLGWTVTMALGGAVAGILQWLVLREQVFRAGWWVLASTVSWGLSIAVVGAFSIVGVDLFTVSLFGGSGYGRCPVLAAATTRTRSLVAV